MLQVVSLMEGEWSCYRGGQFNRGRMVMLREVVIMGVMMRWRLSTRVLCLICYGSIVLCYGRGQFNGRSKVMLGGQEGEWSLMQQWRWSL